MEESSVVWALVALLVLAAVLIIWLLMRQRRSRQVRQHFGPEYTEAVHRTGDPVKAEAELLEREKRVKKFNIRPLSTDEHSRFTDHWHRLQEIFVDNPGDAVAGADDLLGQVMQTRGYPVSDFEQRSADLSVDYPFVVEHYRAGHAIALRRNQGQADTEELRQALIHYRELFDELVTDGRSGSVNVRRAEETRRA